MSKRIQYRGRLPGWTMPANAIYVGRHANEQLGRFGNPFDIQGAIEYGFADDKPAARRICIDNHRRWLNGDTQWPDVLRLKGRPYDRRVVLASLPDLIGHDLACWCAPDLECHADTLLALLASISRSEVAS